MPAANSGTSRLLPAAATASVRLGDRFGDAALSETRAFIRESAAFFHS
jgi:hypothetical protein